MQKYENRRQKQQQNRNTNKNNNKTETVLLEIKSLTMITFPRKRKKTFSLQFCTVNVSKKTLFEIVFLSDKKLHYKCSVSWLGLMIMEILYSCYSKQISKIILLKLEFVKAVKMLQWITVITLRQI